MKKKEINYYYKSFESLFEFTLNAANYLEETIKNFDCVITEKQVKEMHEIEHAADLYLHDVLAVLAKEFITPIENEDILNIIKKIDDATDAIEDVVIKMYIHNVDHLFASAQAFANIITRECLELKKVILEFPNFKRSTTIKQEILNVLSIEEEGDKLYMSSVRNLYKNVTDAKEIYLMEDLIKGFEKCCDKLEEVAQALDEAIMKNI